MAPCCIESQLSTAAERVADVDARCGPDDGHSPYDGLTGARADDLSGRTWRGQTSIALGTNTDEPALVEPPLQNRMIARGVAAVVPDLDAKQTCADENSLHRSAA